MPKRIIQDIDPSCDLETSWVRRGANPMAKVFLKKSADQPQPEITDMALKSVVLAGLMTSTVGAALAKSFKTDADLDTFVAKTDAEQKADLEAFAKANKMPMDDGDEDDAANKVKKAADDKAEAEKLAKAAPDQIAAAIAKALEESPVVKALRDENAALKAGLEKSATEARDTQIRKQAEGLTGCGLSVDETSAVLKALDGSDEAVRKSVEQVLKAHAELTRKVAKASGFTVVEKDGSTPMAKLTKAAEDLAKSASIPLTKAWDRVNEDPQYADLLEQIDSSAAA